MCCSQIPAAVLVPGNTGLWGTSLPGFEIINGANSRFHKLPVSTSADPECDIACGTFAWWHDNNASGLDSWGYLPDVPAVLPFPERAPPWLVNRLHELFGGKACSSLHSRTNWSFRSAFCLY